MSANGSIDQFKQQRMNRLLAALLLVFGAGALSTLVFEGSPEEGALVVAASAVLFVVCAIGLVRGWRWAKSVALVLLWLCAATAIIQAAISVIALTAPPVSANAVWLVVWHVVVACGIVAATVWSWRSSHNGV
jgi:hypothetical protein